MVFSLEGVVGPQRDAVTHRDGRLVVLGGAGTGKTRVIEERFGWLVSEGREPGRIALVCPSAGAADAMRMRLEAALDWALQGGPCEKARR